TYPLIGNYGTNDTDIESKKVQSSGFIVGSYEDEWSNADGKSSLDEYLNKNKITAITGIDTRALTKMVRSEGAMRGMITGEKLSNEKLVEKVKELSPMAGQDLVKFVTSKESYELKAANHKYRIAVYDFGIKQNILREFLKFDTELKIFPAQTDYKEILDYKPDGIFLSNGPGDPEAVKYGIENTQSLMDKGIPIFGICLGHQLTALALGAS